MMQLKAASTAVLVLVFALCTCTLPYWAVLMCGVLLAITVLFVWHRPSVVINVYHLPTADGVDIAMPRPTAAIRVTAPIQETQGDPDEADQWCTRPVQETLM